MAMSRYLEDAKTQVALDQDKMARRRARDDASRSKQAKKPSHAPMTDAEIRQLVNDYRENAQDLLLPIVHELNLALTQGQSANAQTQDLYQLRWSGGSTSYAMFLLSRPARKIDSEDVELEIFIKHAPKANGSRSRCTIAIAPLGIDGRSNSVFSGRFSTPQQVERFKRQLAYYLVKWGV